MKNITKLLIVATVFTASPAFANCGNVSICSGIVCPPAQYACDNSPEQPVQPQYQSQYVKPLEIAPPPIGASQCEWVQVNGQWQNVCY